MKLTSSLRFALYGAIGILICAVTIFGIYTYKETSKAKEHANVDMDSYHEAIDDFIFNFDGGVTKVERPDNDFKMFKIHVSPAWHVLDKSQQETAAQNMKSGLLNALAAAHIEVDDISIQIFDENKKLVAQKLANTNDWAILIRE